MKIGTCIASPKSLIPSAGRSKYTHNLDKRDLELIDGNPRSRFFPYCSSFTDSAPKTTEEFEYLRPLNPSNKSSFLAELKPLGDLDVVKFDTGYSVNAEEDAKARGRFSLYFGPH